MDCTRFEELMSAALDGELSPAERRELDRHLAQCPACAAEFEELRTQCAALRELDCPFPEGLHDRIVDGLPEQERPAPRKPAAWRRWGGVAACLLLVGALWAALPQKGAEDTPALASVLDEGPDGAGPDEDAAANGGASPGAQGDAEAAKRSAGAVPEAAEDGVKDAQADPYDPYAYVLTESDSVGAPVHYGFENDQYIRVTYGYAPEPGARIIGSAQSWEEYTAQFPFDGLHELLSGYDEAYFETGRLLAAVLEEPSGSIRHEIPAQGLRRDQVFVAQTSPYGTEDMAAWLILAEVDATFHDGDELTVTVIPYEEYVDYEEAKP